MKKLSLLILFVFVIGCSIDDQTSNKRCYYYTIIVLDECDCFACGFRYYISEEEYIRLLDIIENSNEPCNYIYSEDYSSGENFEGFVNEINKTRCLYG